MSRKWWPIKKPNARPNSLDGKLPFVRMGKLTADCCGSTAICPPGCHKILSFRIAPKTDQFPRRPGRRHGLAQGADHRATSAPEACPSVTVRAVGEIRHPRLR